VGIETAGGAGLVTAADLVGVKCNPHVCRSAELLAMQLLPHPQPSTWVHLRGLSCT
jgi:hypothetical protein